MFAVCLEEDTPTDPNAMSRMFLHGEAGQMWAVLKLIEKNAKIKIKKRDELHNFNNFRHQYVSI
jgi:hypothetical protein